MEHAEMDQKPTMESVIGAGKRQKRPRADDLTRFGLLVGRPSPKKKKSNRRYNESYLKYGFIATGEQHDQRPLCVVCTDTLSNDALKPSKLRRHFESRHPELKDMTLEYFEQRKQTVVKQIGQNRLPLVAKTAKKMAAVKKKDGLVIKKERKRRVNKQGQDQVPGVAQPYTGKKRGRKPKVRPEGQDQVPSVVLAQQGQARVPIPIFAQEAQNQVPMVAQEAPNQVPIIVAQEPQSELPSVSHEAHIPLPSVSQEGQGQVPSVSMTPTRVAAPEKKPEPARKPPSNVVALRVGLSNLVASLIGEIEEPFTISEELILPACELIFREILGESAIHNIARVRPSEDEIAGDIEAQLLERIGASPWYAIQVDDVANDVYNKAVVLVYVRYIFEEDLHEDFLCAPSLPANATAEQLFVALDRFVSGKLDWSSCVGLSTDGAAAAAPAGRLSPGFTARVKQVAPECESTHCVIHREMLLAGQNTQSPELIGVLTDVVNVVNYVRAHAVNSHLFEQMCGGDTDADLKCLLLHTEVRWLSKGRSLARVFESRGPLQRFLNENDSPLAAQFADGTWVAKLAYLCDMFTLLNEFNLSLQGRMTNVFTVTDKVAALKAKLALWARRVDKGSFDMFHSLAEVLGDTETVPPSFTQMVSHHLASLSVELERYFPTKEQSSNEWIRDPFVNVPGDESLSLSTEEERQLVEVANNGGLKSLFWITSSLPTFWLKLRAGYPELAARALKTLLTFPTTSLCEAGFVSMMARKTEIQNRLQSTLRVSLVRTPRLDCLLARKHCSAHPMRKENGSH